MKLDDKPLRSLLAERDERLASLEQVADRACALIAAELAPFEKYCGKVAIAFTSGPKTRITAHWPYRAPCGTKLAFTACLEHHALGWIMVSGRRGTTVKLLSPEGIAAAFIQVIEKAAEAAFEAVVLGEGWRLRHILQ